MRDKGTVVQSHLETGESQQYMRRGRSLESGSFPLFSTLDLQGWAYLRRSASFIQLKKGQTAFTQGMNAYGVYLLLRGKVKLTQLHPEGKSLLLRFVLPGEFFGTAALAGRKYHGTTATALETCEVCFIPTGEFLTLCERYPQLALNIIKHLAQEVDEVRQYACMISYGGAQAKLAWLLLKLKEAYGVDEEEDRESLTLKLTERELGEMIGLSRETVCRELQELCSRGFVMRDHRRTRILDREGLQSLIGRY
jgi:CRP/FNR family transcriptional regulator